LLSAATRERLLERCLCTKYNTPSRSDRRLTVVCEMHVGKVSCRLTLDESEGVVLCNRDAGPHKDHKPRTVISPIDAERPLQKRVAGSAWSGHPTNERLHSSAFGSTLSTRRKGRLFTKRNEITRLSSELRCPHAYRIQRGVGLPVIDLVFSLTAPGTADDNAAWPSKAASCRHSRDSASRSRTSRDMTPYYVRARP
jgi:hypothetical protein